MLKSSAVLVGIVAALIVAGSAYAFLVSGAERELAPPTHALIQPREALPGQGDQSAVMAEPLGNGAQRNAEAIAAKFDMTMQDVMTLHDGGFGFGAIVKLAVVAKAKGVSVHSLASSLPRMNGQQEAAVGELFKTLSPEEKTRIDGLPTNLGQIKKAQAGKVKPK